MHVEKSIAINATTEKIATVLKNFNEWKAWSPWLIMDPQATVTIADDNKSYAWEGKRVGEGNMVIDNVIANEEINYSLTFLKPWKSKAKVKFVLTQENENTKLTWLMDSSLPFFLFFLKKMMTAFIGMDYERGLTMLKEYIEQGEVNSTLGFEGIHTVDSCQYIAVKRTCSAEELEKSMPEDFGRVYAPLMENMDNVAGNPFTIYDKWDVVNNKVTYKACVPVKEIPSELAEGIFSENLPQLKANKIKHTGAYHHLGNAWTAAYSMGRNKEFKINKKTPPFEVYLNSPKDTAPKDLMVEVFIPAK